MGEVGSAVVRTTEGVTRFRAFLSHVKREGILRGRRISTISNHGAVFFVPECRFPPETTSRPRLASLRGCC